MKLIKGVLAAAATAVTFASPAAAQTAQCGVYVFFNSGQAVLGQQAADVLREYARNNPGAEVRIAGYSDASGSTAANQALSLQRAQSVAAALAGTQIIEVAGVGEAVRPGASGPLDPSNRRVEVVRQNCVGGIARMDNTGLAIGAGVGALALAALLAGDGDESGTTTTTTTP
ncbi:OmpA family protein [Roseivivax sp. CAU 1761]